MCCHGFDHRENVGMTNGVRGFSASNLLVTDVVFEENTGTAPLLDSGGAVIFLQSDVDLTMDRVRFLFNENFVVSLQERIRTQDITGMSLGTEIRSLKYLRPSALPLFGEHGLSNIICVKAALNG